MVYVGEGEGQEVGRDLVVRIIISRVHYMHSYPSFICKSRALNRFNVFLVSLAAESGI